MNVSHKQLCIGLAVVAAMLPAVSAHAQDRPVSPDAQILLGQENAAVVALIESNPKMADDLVPAIITMLRFKKPILAQGFARRLAGLKMDEQQLADLGEKLGSRPFGVIINNKIVNETAGDFCRAVLAALKKRKTDSSRLDKLADVASNASGFARRQAIFDLQEAGPESIAALARVLSNPAKAKGHYLARDALVQFGKNAVGPLLAVLTSDNENLKTEALLALSRLKAQEAMYPMLANAVARQASSERRNAARLGVSNLLGYVPTEEDATKLLYQAATKYLEGRIYIRSDVDNIADHWKWDGINKKLVNDREPVKTVGAIRAARIMEQLLTNAQVPQTQRLSELTTNQRAIMRMTMIAILQANRLKAGMDAPLVDALKQAYLQGIKSPAAMEFDLVEDALELAMDRDYLPAAISAAELLGAAAASVGGCPHLIRRRNPQRCPLVRAAGHSDRRLRFAATKTILMLQPDYAFAGSSAVTDSLRYFANATDSRRVLIAEPRRNRGQLMVGLLSENGFEPQWLHTGRQTLLTGTKSPEFQVAFISYTVGRPDIRELHQDFRSDPRTSDIPVGLIVDPEDVVEAGFFADEDPLTRMFVVPRDASTMQMRVDQLKTAAGLQFVPHEVRMKQASAAMRMIAAIAQQEQAIFDLNGMESVLETALYLPTLSRSAASALGNLASPEAQRTLVNMAGQRQLPLADRKVAAESFAIAVRRRGIGLTARQISDVSMLYDQIFESDPESEEVLWSILDAIQTKGKGE
jgi:hypothetical protein